MLGEAEAELRCVARHQKRAAPLDDVGHRDERQQQRVVGVDKQHVEDFQPVVLRENFSKERLEADPRVLRHRDATLGEELQELQIGAGRRCDGRDCEEQREREQYGMHGTGSNEV